MDELKRGDGLVDVGLERESQRGAREEWNWHRAAGAVFAAPTYRDLLCITSPEAADVFRHYVHSLIFAYYPIIKE